MQFSSNSNEGIRALIRACPTFAGQYRQAVLQKRDRHQSLAAYRFSLRKYQARLKIKQVNRTKLERQLEAATDPLEQEELAARLELAKAIADEAEYAMVQAADLIEDAIREIAICDEEIERIVSESGIEFKSLDTQSFQELMSLEFRVKRSRWIAARLLGLPAEAAEALLEIPEGDRGEYLFQVFYETNSLAQMLATAEGESKGAIASAQASEVSE